MVELFPAVNLYLNKTAGLIFTGVALVQQRVAKTGYTHTFCVEQAITILKRDGLEDFSQIAAGYFKELKKGILWADTSWKCTSHFYNPQSKKGWSNLPNAVQEGEIYWHKAIAGWNKGQRKKAFFYLGACAHLIQDMCVPHHARGVVFAGHQEYENWAEGGCSQFKEDSCGEYGIGNTPERWIHHNALISADFFSQVKEGASIENFIKATETILPLAQRTTAGFIASFLWQVKV
jgi:phospholipase C